MLYNLAEDPYEVVDRAADRPEIRDALRAELESIAESVRTDPIRPSWVQTNREGI